MGSVNYKFHLILCPVLATTQWLSPVLSFLLNLFLLLLLFLWPHKPQP